MPLQPIPPQAQMRTDVPPIADCGEPLVSLTNYSSRIQVYPYYFHQQVNGALPDCLVRKGVADRLVNAAEQLDEGYTLVVLDGWRPLSVQQALYDQFKALLLAKGWLPGEELDTELHKYVAKPSVNPDQPSRHLTGGAVDVTIAGPDGWLDMGTDFDDFTARARTRYFEEAVPMDSLHVQANRRLLYQLMTGAGFTNYAEEWWHYDYGNQAWASQNGRSAAIYGGVLAIY